MISRRLVTLVAAAALVAGYPSATGSTPPAPPTLAFVLAGQSNMLGRGFPLAEGDPSDPSLLVWRPQAGQGWKVAADPLGDPSVPTDGIGPGMSFGRTVVAATGESVGLIQCATGGSTISDWQPGNARYRRCLKQVHTAGVPIAGVLFLQGESDATGHGTAQNWEKKFLKLAARFGKDFSTSIVVGQIGTLDPGKFRYQAMVRAEQQDAAQTLGDPLVVTSDLPMQPGEVHFTVDSYKVIGQRYAAAWLSFPPTPAPTGS